MQWLPAMACMPRPTTRLQTGRSWTGCSTSVKRQSRAPSRFVRQALRIASTRTRALSASSPDFAICASSPNVSIWGLRATNVGAVLSVLHSILNGNQFQIVGRKDFPLGVLHFQSRGFSGAFVQNLKTFLAAGKEMTFSPLAQSSDDREQLSAFLG